MKRLALFREGLKARLKVDACLRFCRRLHLDAPARAWRRLCAARGGQPAEHGLELLSSSRPRVLVTPPQDVPSAQHGGKCHAHAPKKLIPRREEIVAKI